MSYDFINLINVDVDVDVDVDSYVLHLRGER